MYCFLESESRQTRDHEHWQVPSSRVGSRGQVKVVEDDCQFILIVKVPHGRIGRAFTA